MNSLSITGNLTRDPETRTTSTGQAMTNFTVAVNMPRRRDETQFFRVTAFGKLAEICSNSLKKGHKVGVVGAVHLHTYTTKTGETRASMDMDANELDLLTPRDKATEGFIKVEEGDLLM